MFLKKANGINSDHQKIVFPLIFDWKYKIEITGLKEDANNNVLKLIFLSVG